VEKLAKQLGLPPAIAQMVVSFVLSKMLGSAQTQSQATRPSQAVPSPRKTQQQKQTGQTLDLDDLLGQISAGETVDTVYLDKTGMTQELVQKTGMDRDTAAASLQEVLKAFGGALGPRPPSRQSSQAKRGASADSGLDSLLDDFKAS